MTGCAGLPQDVQRPESHAVEPEGTALHALVAQRRAQAGARAASGFALLDGPQAAYGSRLALVEAAQKTLDLQYYAIHADASNSRLLRSVGEAAARGVRVRILLDDFHTTGRNAQVLQLAYVPNVQMRLFNPLPGSRDSTVRRVIQSLGDVQRIQQRMHNKLFIADNALGITGGRNLGDAYFGLGESGNFVDLDVLAAGPIVREMSRSFDSYWNNERAYPVQSLVTPKELAEMRERQRRAPQEAEGAEGAPRPPDGEPRPGPGQPDPAQEAIRRARAWDHQPMDLRTQPFVWAPSALQVDAPAKIPADAQAAASPAPDAPAPARGQLPEGETVVDGLLRLIAEAQQDLLIISPYFVPGADMKKAFADAVQRGVRVRVLTNSLASNDAPIAHVGYARHRRELLDAGVQLYEMRSEQAGLGSALGSSAGSASATGQSRAMLHSKVLVRDGRLLVIGSMNLDLRSQLQNTEIALLIRSRELSAQATELIERSLREGSWRVEREKEGSGGLVWRAPAGSALADARTEPDSSLGLRLLLRVIGPLAPDEML
ncbi:phospholipase D family protein [Xenophilus arseniciresistens]|uniref:Phospholipase D family protein n=2 Tax=Xenophilus arseniciresistens TaxID=1283306 RepID=A0AAE3N900_9BURK|nr:phospholipase D family protein [Xenophilus arseniciresistens]MDA7417023.1 phospholipase D family protein [Xenophilus arseniciresistens]